MRADANARVKRLALDQRQNEAALRRAKGRCEAAARLFDEFQGSLEYIEGRIKSRNAPHAPHQLLDASATSPAATAAASSAASK